MGGSSHESSVELGIDPGLKPLGLDWPPAAVPGRLEISRPRPAQRLSSTLSFRRSAKAVISSTVASTSARSTNSTGECM